MRIVADNPDLERHLSRMHDIIVENGGDIHEECVIDARGGDLRVEASDVVPQRVKLIKVPSPLLLPVDGFGLRVEGDDIVLGDRAEGITDVQVELMEIMAAIYNISGKIKHHREHFPSRLFLEQPEIYQRLVMESQYQARAKANSETFLLDDFLHTRQFGMKGDGEEERSPVLMPIIDFLNHHQAAAGFQVADEELFVLRRSPVSGSNECYVSYSRMDAQVALFGYGFVDTSSTQLLSVPLTIRLKGITDIKVNRVPGVMRKQPPPPALKDIQRVVPRMTFDPEQKLAQVSFLIIPDARSPRALRRVLMSVIGGFMGNRPPGNVQLQLREAERQVIDANRKYYKGLVAYASSLDLEGSLKQIADDTATMAEHQLRLLDAYEMNIAQFGN